MMRVVFFMGGVAVGGALVIALTQPASESKCCRRIGLAVRDELANRTGIAGHIFDVFGITSHIPGILDKAGLL